MSLQFLSQPGSDADGIEFYKDEGGKGNWMSLKIILTKNNSPNSNTPLELRTELYFESGLPVEASDQKIMLVRFNGQTSLTEPPLNDDEAGPNDGGDTEASDPSTNNPLRSIVLTRKELEKNTGVLVEFRIQKVSRRKDNQRFMVKISTSDTTIQPIYSRPVTVLSKRKIPARLRNDPEAIARYKAAKMSKAQSNRAASKRARSAETTPELRPLTVAAARGRGSSKRSAGGGSKKRARTSTTTSSTNEVAFQNKIDQMSHTINQLYDMMQDQRIQINQLQEQVRILNDSNMGLGFAVLDGAFEVENAAHVTVELNSPSSSPTSSALQRSSVLDTSTMLTALDMLSTSSGDISTTFDDSTEKAMAQDYQNKTKPFQQQQRNFDSSTHVSMPPLPVLNL